MRKVKIKHYRTTLMVPSRRHFLTFPLQRRVEIRLPSFLQNRINATFASPSTPQSKIRINAIILRLPPPPILMDEVPICVCQHSDLHAQLPSLNEN